MTGDAKRVAYSGSGMADQREKQGGTSTSTQTDRPGGTTTAADRAPGQYQFGALPPRNDAAGLGQREPGAGDRSQLVQADEDTVRDVIHRFNEIGLACLDPSMAGGRPRPCGQST
ncbi:hypothetical protein GCM10010286_64310 [Streptomyces toxytricini]|nr:hypothetical protein GCM10010286_64310 [Streptomyces toxytricini]